MSGPKDPASSQDGILEGFAGMSKSPPGQSPSAELSQQNWTVAHDKWEADQQLLISGYKQLLNSFNESWGRAMNAIEKYREAYARALSGSTEMQGLMVSWAEEQQIRHKQDVAFAIAQLVIGAPALYKLGKTVVKTSVAAGGKIISAGKNIFTQAALQSGRTLFKSLAYGEVQQGPRIAAALAVEAGVDLNAVLARHGGSYSEAIAELFNLVFARRKWHYLADTAVFVDASLVEVKTADLMTRVSTNLHTAAAAAAKGEQAVSAAQLAKDLQVLQEIAKREPLFLESLKTAVVDITFPAAKAVGGAKGTGDATVLLLDAADANLIKMWVESGGDMSKVERALGPAGWAWLTESAAVQGVQEVTAWGGMATTAGLLAQGALADAQPGEAIDVVALQSSFGLDFDSWWQPFAHGLWGFFTSPFETYGQLTNQWEALSLGEQFLHDHGDDLLQMAAAIDDLSHSLEQASNAIRLSRLPGETKYWRDRLEGDVDAMATVISSAGNQTAEWRQKRTDEYLAIREEVEEKLSRVDHVAQQLRTDQGLFNQVATFLNQWRKHGNFLVIDPQMFMKLEAVRAILIPQMASLRMSALPGNVEVRWGWNWDHAIKTAMNAFTAGIPKKGPDRRRVGILVGAGALVIGAGLVIGNLVGQSHPGVSSTPSQPGSAVVTATASTPGETMVTSTASPAPTVPSVGARTLSDYLQVIGIDLSTYPALAAALAADGSSDWIEKPPPIDPAQADMLATLTFKATLGTGFLSDLPACSAGLICGTTADGAGMAVGPPGDYSVYLMQMRGPILGVPTTDIGYFELGVVNYDLTPAGGGQPVSFDRGLESFLTGSNTAYSIRFTLPSVPNTGTMYRLVHGENDPSFHSETTSGFAYVLGNVMGAFIPYTEWDGAADFRLYSYYQSNTLGAVSDTVPGMTQAMTPYDRATVPGVDLP